MRRDAAVPSRYYLHSAQYDRGLVGVLGLFAPFARNFILLATIVTRGGAGGVAGSVVAHALRKVFSPEYNRSWAYTRESEAVRE